MGTMIHALLFDLGDVLIGLDFDRAYRAAARVSPYSENEIRDRLRDLELARPYECGQIDSREFYVRCRQGLRLQIDYEGFEALWGDMFAAKPLLDVRWLKALAERYRMVLLSNTNELHFEWIRGRYTIIQPFHVATLSYQVGSMKPEAAIYRAAIEAAGCAPEECFFTDDKLENIEAARALGIQAEVFSGAANLRRALREAGVSW